MRSSYRSFAIAVTVIYRRVFSLPDFRRPARACAFLLCLCFPAGAAAQQISLNIERIDGPFLSASKISGVLRPGTTSSLELTAAQVSSGGETWHNVRIVCPELTQERDQLSCPQATLETPAKMAVSFRYSTRTKNLELALRPAANEEWRLTLADAPAGRTVVLDIQNGVLARFKAWWPATWPKPNAGTLSGRVTFSEGGETSVQGQLALVNFGFADDSGLHAAEKINAVLTLQAQQQGTGWRWQSRLDWKNGDVFWEPLFVSGFGHALSLAGIYDGQHVAIEQGRLALAGIADVDLTAQFDRAQGRLSAASAKSTNVDVAG